MRAPADARTKSRTAAERQLRAVTLGAGAVLGQGPLDRQQDDQRAHGDRARRSRRSAGRSRRGGACSRPTATTSGTPPSSRPRPASRVKQPFFIHPADGGVLAMAGLYEIWRDPTRDEDDPPRFLWTCTVLTTTAEDARRPHPRPDAADGGAASATPPGSTRRSATSTSCTALLVPAAPGPARGLPGVAPQVNNVRNNGPELLDAAGRPEADRTPMTDASAGARPRTATPACTGPLAAPGRHAAARARRRRRRRRARPGGARRGPARARHLGGPASSSRGGWPARRSRPAPRSLDECFVAAADKLRVAHPAGRRRAQRRRPLGGAHRPRARRRRAASPWRSRCTRPAGRSSPRLDELRGRAGADAGGPGGAGRLRPARGVPAGPRAHRRPRRRPRLQGAQARAGHRARRRWRIIVEAVLEFVVRDVVGGSGNQIRR